LIQALDMEFQCHPANRLKLLSHRATFRDAQRKL
jgi:hypothetical protein